MFQLTALYNPPADPAVFDKHYTEVHTPLALTVPGLQRFSATHPASDLDGNPSPYYLIAILEFESPEAFQAGLGSPEGQALAGDLPNFAQAGVQIVVGPGVVN